MATEQMRPMSPPAADDFVKTQNIRIGIRGRGGSGKGHRHTQSSAAILARSAYSGALPPPGAGGDNFLPLPPPSSRLGTFDEGDDESGPGGPGFTIGPGPAAAPGTPKDWQTMGAQILGGALPPPNAASSRRSKSPPTKTPSSTRHRSTKQNHNFSLASLDLNDAVEAGELDADTMPARESIVNKFAMEVMRSYPPELAATLGLPSAQPGESPAHRRNNKTSFVIDDLDTSSWVAPSLDTASEAELTNALVGIRASASRSFEAFRRSKKTSTPDAAASSASIALQAESKELEQELINALETEIKGLRVERQRMEVKYARLKEKNGALAEQMRGLKEELEQLRANPAVANQKHRRDSLGVTKSNGSKDGEAASSTSPGNGGGGEDSARVASLEADVQEKALALKSVRKQFVDVLIKQQRAEKINTELQNELESEKTRQTELQNQLTSATDELTTLREKLAVLQTQYDDKAEEVETLRMDHKHHTAELVDKHEKRVQKLLRDAQAELAAERANLEALKEKHSKVQTQNSADMNAALVKEMGKMLKEAIEKSTKKSTQVETAMNNGSDVTVDTKDMFKCLTCSYINASIRLVCHNCGSKRFADLRNEKERKHIRKQWVNSLVNMYLNMLEEILKTPRGEKVVQGEARHSNKTGAPITSDQIRAAEEKIQRMLQAAATQKGRQKFSEVYPKLESSSTAGDSESMDEGSGGSQPKMKRYVRSVVGVQKAAAAEKKARDNDSIVPAGTLVYAKWYGPEREKYPDWYEAAVDSVEGPDSYVIKYQNGTLCRGVPRKDIRTRRSS